MYIKAPTAISLLVSLSLFFSSLVQNRFLFHPFMHLFHLEESSLTTADPSETSLVNPGTVQEFELLSEKTAWILVEDDLYWSGDSGANWEVITPADLAERHILAVDFIDEQRGWLAALDPREAANPAYTLFSTADGGKNWDSWPLDLFPPGDAAAFPSQVQLSMQDSLPGYLMIRQMTSSNFRLGTLFQTVDGGRNWTLRAIPIGEKVAFFDLNQGWTAGGAASDELYVTRDGGLHWDPVLEDLAGSRAGDLTQLPVSNPQGITLLPILRDQSGSGRVLFYASTDAGRSWNLSAWLEVPQTLEAGSLVPLSPAGEGSFLFFLPGDHRLYEIRPQDGTISVIADQADLAGLTTLQMVSATYGWALTQHGSCQSGVCRQENRILATQDGWQSWQPVTLPVTAAEPPDSAPVEAGSSSLNPEIADLSLTLTLAGQAFDKCEIPSLDKLQDWFNHSPYKTVNLYIGGVSRACANSALSGPYIHEISEQGWRFIPTWVGPQAYCTSFTNKIPKDKNSAYQKGIEEANKAVDQALSFGLTQADKSGSVIYYDLESFDTSDTACLESAKSFVSGWSYQMRLLGNVPGLYGTASNLDFLHSASNPPDVVWLAHWIYSSYNASATVYSKYLHDSYWANHQRIRQYAGDHTETWGSTQIGGIDSNVVDGMVSDITGTYPLSLVKSGNGSGTVVSTPSGINCGNFCFTNFSPNSSLTLTATPATGSSFTGWSSNCQVTGSNTCQVTIDGYKEITATFSLNSYELSVSKDGNGSGKVVSSPGGIDCGSDCVNSYLYGSIVTLTAQPANDSTLTAWNGPCTSTGEFTCEVKIELVNQVTATFQLAHLLTVKKAGSGKGTVTSSPSGINCGSDCTQKYEIGKVVTLTASASPGSKFSGWSGPCSSTTATTCTMHMDLAREVTATFISNYLYMPWTGKD
jgi:uncharacterized protein (DUF2141 family)